jgi:phosphate-selective porin
MATSADRELLEILLENGVITQAQFDRLITKESISTGDIIPGTTAPEASDTQAVPVASPAGAVAITEEQEQYIDGAITQALAAEMDSRFPIDVSYGSKGFRFETRDGNFQTNLQWRAQLRYTNPYTGDPRRLSNFEDDGSSGNFEPRRLRMKIGGHGFAPWVKYYFEVDLQPARDPDADAVSSAARVIDYRIDLAKWDALGLRVGQWKIDYNRERVDSSGKQQFVERSIVNRIFTVDRQVGIQLRGRLFKETPADIRYYAGVFNGEGRAVRSTDGDEMYVGRLQWNFLGRDLSLRQTDVEFTEKPTATLAFGGATTTGPCTRWSSSGCGNLDGFASPLVAEDDQFKIRQAVQEFAFKYRGFSVQQEYHVKEVTDRVENTKNDLTGAYFQTGYFFHNLVEAIPSPLELAVRYAFVDEPNRDDRAFENNRKEYTLAANWFFAGHRNKLTLDYSYLTIDDGLLNVDDDANRIRFQWDVSF